MRRLRLCLAAALVLLFSGHALAESTRAWVERAVLYGVIPRRFGPGGLDAVTARLDSLQSLGVDTLWLPPPTATPDGDFGYAVLDYFHLRRDFGPPAALERLVIGAHRRGMRVILDFVPNHTSADHPCFRDAQARGPESDCFRFYDHTPDGRPTHYFDWNHLPNLHYGDPVVEEMVIRAFASWVRRFDIDGFRVDAAWAVRARSPRFFAELRRRLDALKPGLALVVEGSARDGGWPKLGADAAYDWTEAPGRWAWEKVFEREDLIVPRLHAALVFVDVAFRGGHARVLRFLDNNDTGARFITRHGVGLTRAATALLFTLPGLPLVYTGEEVGAEYDPYDGGGAIEWRDRHALASLHRRLIALRRRVPALASNRWRPLPFRPGARTYAFLRHPDGNGPPALVLVNFGAHPARTRLVLPEDAAALRDAPLTDAALDEKSFAVRSDARGRLDVRVPGHGFRVLVPSSGSDAQSAPSPSRNRGSASLRRPDSPPIRVAVDAAHADPTR